MHAVSKVPMGQTEDSTSCPKDYWTAGLQFPLLSPLRQNCILADEMGLGKTIQSIAFLQEVYNVGIRGPFLVIAPLSTITNWEREFNTWTEMNTIVYHGSLASRQMIQQYEMYCKDSRVRKVSHCNISTPETKQFFKSNL